MKKFLNIISLLLCTAFIGCSAKASSNGSLLEDIKQNNKIVVGMNAEFAPYEFHAMVDGKDTIVGFDVELAKEIAKDLGVELEIKELAFDALLTTLQNKQVDVIISAMSGSQERRKSVDFSDIYYETTNVALVNKDDLASFNSFEDLKDKQVGLQLSSIQDNLISQLIPEGNFTKIESMNTLFLSLKTKQLDAIVTSDMVSKIAAIVNPEFAIAESVKIDSSSLGSMGAGVVIRYGDENATLKEQINATIKRLNDSGEMDKFVDDAVEIAASLQQ
jgi:ABC-type amino acid transport/signal transduction systems, periplasmic component/domain